jgi:NTP pyrophosphatase (non-canonical NTP hydrolase)
MSDETKTTPEAAPRAAVGSTDGLADSPTWPYVLAFAKRMEAKLEKNRHKGDRSGWLLDEADELLERLREELCELDDAMVEAVVRMHEPLNARWIAENVANEAADVANFAMMLADWHTARVPESANDRISDGADNQ